MYIKWIMKGCIYIGRTYLVYILNIIWTKFVCYDIYVTEKDDNRIVVNS
jgi:hypothetical protein